MNKAFTLVEIIIAISVLMILTGLGALSLVSSGKSSSLEQAKSLTIVALREAQTNSLTGLDGLAWGVLLEENRLIIFADSGSGFQAGDSKNQPRILPAGAILSWDINGAGAEILFDPRSGKTANFGTLTVSDGNLSVNINLSQEGVIDY